MRRWSKLKARVENLLRPGCDVRFTKYRMQSQRGSSDLPRLLIVVDKEIVFDYPKNFPDKTNGYPYIIPDFSTMLETYVQTNPQELHGLTDEFGLYALLRTLDRRFEQSSKQPAA